MLAEPSPGPDPSLRVLVRDALAGRPPAPDGGVTVLPANGGLAGVLAFTAHHVVVADVDPSWVHRRVAPGDMSTPVSGGFLDDLGREIGRRYDNLDLVLSASVLAGAPDPVLGLTEVGHLDHPRVDRALRYREQVRVWATGDGAGVLILAVGLGGRWEAAFEVEAGARGRGLGRRLATAARHLVPEGERLAVQVSPGNVASLRAVLGAGGFQPVGAEALFPSPAEEPDRS